MLCYTGNFFLYLTASQHIQLPHSPEIPYWVAPLTLIHREIKLYQLSSYQCKYLTKNEQQTIRVQMTVSICKMENKRQKERVCDKGVRGLHGTARHGTNGVRERQFFMCQYACVFVCVRRTRKPVGQQSICPALSC